MRARAWSPGLGTMAAVVPATSPRGQLLFEGSLLISIRTTRRMLNAATAVMTVAAVLAVGLAFGLPIEQKIDDDSASGQSGGKLSAQTRPSSTSATPLVAALEPVFSLRLRQSPGQTTGAGATNAAPAPAHAPDPVPVAASDLPPYTLVGTVGDSLALLRGADGTVEIRGVNESVGGVEVLAIQPGSIRVRYNGKVITLDKPKEPSLPGETSAQSQ
jgi:hypothetical protein